MTKEIVINSGRKKPKSLSNANGKRNIKTDMHFSFSCSCSFGHDFRELVRLYGKIRKPLI